MLFHPKVRVYIEAIIKHAAVIISGKSETFLAESFIIFSSFQFRITQQIQHKLSQTYFIISTELHRLASKRGIT